MSAATSLAASRRISRLASRPENFFASVLSATKLPVGSNRVHTTSYVSAHGTLATRFGRCGYWLLIHGDLPERRFGLREAKTDADERYWLIEK